MAIDLNCDCDCPYDRKTLGELVQAVRDGCGFLDILAGPFRTLQDLREDILDQLGLTTPMNIQVRTLGSMVADLSSLLGMAAQNGNYSPGWRDEAVAQINKAQQNAWRRIELDRGAETAPAVLDLDADNTEKVDCEITFAFAVAYAKAFRGQPDAKLYAEEAEKHLADWLARHPPNIEAMVNTYLKSAHRTVVRQYAQGASGTIADSTFTADSDSTSVDAQPVMLLAMAQLKAKIGQGDAKVAMELYNQYMQDQLKRSPPNAGTVIRNLLRQAQETLFRKYDVFRMDRWYTWTMTPGLRFYGIGENDEQIGLTDPPVIVSAVVATTGGTLGPGTYKYCVTAVVYDSGTAYVGQTQLSTEVEVTISSGTTNKVTLTWEAPDVPTGGYPIFGYDVWGRSASHLHLATIGALTLSYVDTGSATPVPEPATPTTNTTKPSACLKSLDPRKVHYVGISRDDTSWRELRKGVRPGMYSSPGLAIPTHYDIRQCIELWPSPSEAWQLRIKGSFGLDSFTEDSDLSTIDWQAVQLTALADAKVFYKLPDAEIAKREADQYIRNLNAGSHMTARYIPGERYLPNAVPPNFTGPAY